MNHYNYKITNVKTNEYYIGVRSCECPIEEDRYMGSSSIWTKIYIKEHKKDLKKEILEIFETRRLKEVEGDPLCINRYFDYTPDMTGTKQTPEWIEKRKMFGERNGMFGKHHTEETKKKISEKLKGREVSEEARKKIGDFHRGKVYGKETREKISKSRRDLWYIENIHTKEKWLTTINDFMELFPEDNIIPNSMRKAYSEGCIYKKKYKVIKYAALSEEEREKLGENGEVLIVGNPVEISEKKQKIAND